MNKDKIYRCDHTHNSNESFDKFRFTKIVLDKNNNPRESETTNGVRFVMMTSMDKKYYEASGKAMMASWKRHAEVIGDLFVYNEQLFEPKIKNVQKAGWMLGEEFVKFQRRHSNSKIKTFAKTIHGSMPPPRGIASICGDGPGDTDLAYFRRRPGGHAFWGHAKDLCPKRAKDM